MCGGFFLVFGRFFLRDERTVGSVLEEWLKRIVRQLNIGLRTDVKEMRETFSFIIEVHRKGAYAFAYLCIVVLEVNIKIAHPDKTHTDVAADETFVALIKDMIGHGFKRNVDTTRTAERAFMIL
jgi:hypothetical protein